MESAHGDEGLRKTCLRPLEALRETVQRQESVAHIAQAVQEAERALDTALSEIESFLKKKQEKPDKPGEDKPKVFPAEILKYNRFVAYHFQVVITA